MSPPALLRLVAGLALRNLFRNFRRTVITSIAVVAGVAALVGGWGLVEGMDENVIRAHEDVIAGHVLVRPSGYPADNLSLPLDESLPIPAALLTALDSDRVVAWAPRLMFAARLIDGSDSERIKVIGYDPERDPTVFPRDRWQLQGAWPATAGELAVGSGLADLFDLQLGSPVIVEARSRPGAYNALQFVVSGIVETGNMGVDGLSAWLPLETADQLVLTEGARSDVALRLKSRPEELADLSWLDVPDWTALTATADVADVLAVNAVRRRALTLIIFILMSIAATGIANTVIMAAYERVKEIGTLRAMGLSQGGVRVLFLVEGGVMGLCAGIAGALIGGLVVWHYATVGIDLAGLLKSGGGISFGSTLYLTFSWAAIGFGIAFGAIVALLSSLYPAWHASGMNPADAVRAD